MLEKLFCDLFLLDDHLLICDLELGLLSINRRESLPHLRQLFIESEDLYKHFT
jgi:hypothetical protein